MKKLAVAIAGALFLAASAPVFACPHEDKENNEVKTAEKDKAKDQDKAKTADKDKAKAKDKDKAKEKESKPVAKN
jgi:hypothetical protein